MVNNMNYKHNIKKQSYIIAISAILLALVITGTSYALFFQVDSNSKNQIVETGSLSVTYGANSTAITATELVPMTDTEALESSTLVSTIYVENKGTLPAEYVIKIGNDVDSFQKRDGYSAEDKLLSHDYIKVAVYQNGEMIINPTTLSTLKVAADDNTMYELFSGKLNVLTTGESTETFAIKVWVSNEAPEDIIGDFVYLKVDVTSTVDELSATNNS